MPISNAWTYFIRIKDTFLHVDPLGAAKTLILIFYVVNNFDVS